MSDEKKLTLDDILEEYDKRSTENVPDEDEETVPTDDVEKTFAPEERETTEEKDESSDEDENDNYEDCEEQDISDDISSEPMFKPAELFDGDNGAEIPTESPADDITEEMTENISDNDENSTENAAEEIFADGDADDGTAVPIDIIEDVTAEADPVVGGNADVEIDEADDPEAEIPTEAAAMTWEDNGFRDQAAAEPVVPEVCEENTAEEIKDMPNEDQKDENIPEITADNKDAAPLGNEKKDNSRTDGADAAESVTSDISDVNDKWLIRTAKNIFPVKGDSVGEIIRKIIFLIALIIFIGAGIMLISTLIQSKAALDIKDEAKNVITTTAATYIDDEGNVQTVAPTEEEIAQHNFDVAEHFKKINEDYVGYLEVEGCDIYEPVVQGEDNDKYLKVNIAGGYNKAGTVFMDYRCTVSEEYTSPNIVMYGHNQEDGTMFGNLKEYKQNVEFYREHPLVKFSTEYESGEYIIYGFFVTNVYESQDSNGEVFHYHDYIETLNDEKTFNWYLDEVQERNQIITPVDVKFGDKLLCLSTCSNEFTDSRFVVFARKLRDGESVEDYDLSSAYMNPNAKGVDWDAIITGDPTYVSTVETYVTEDTAETEFTAWDKSIGKNNSGSGASSDGKKFVPPAAIETAAETSVTETSASTAAAETSAATDTETTASETGTETSAPASETSDSAESSTAPSSETSAGESTDTSPSDSEETSVTETSA